MSTITLGTTQFQAFANLQSPTIVVDAAGHIVGTFYPVASGTLVCPYTKEELSRRSAEPGRPLKDILADLEAKHPQ
jgi:hypothetical protein